MTNGFHRDIEDTGRCLLPDGFIYVSRRDLDAHENFLRIRDQKLWDELENKKLKAESGKQTDGSAGVPPASSPGVPPGVRAHCPDCGRNVLVTKDGSFHRHLRLSGLVCIGSARSAF